MCGILGIISDRPDPELMDGVRRSAAMLRHRGPDDEGILALGAPCPEFNGATNVPAHLRMSYEGKAVILAHRRLSIIDLSAAARQPMQLGQSGIFVVFNGEIYNYRELRDELQTSGARFTTSSDTEVLLAAYQAWGVNCVRRFTGMFAFCILDVPRRKVFLARDPFGIKPLFYTENSGTFAFASEIPALLELSGAPRKANAARVNALLTEGVADYGAETFFDRIQQIPPAHCLEVDLSGSRTQSTPVRYWDLACERKEDISFREAATRLRELFVESVSLHLRSDVPLAIALSGGVDSSSVMMAARHIAGCRADLHSFSYIAEDPAISEETWIDDANRAARAASHKVRFGGEDMTSDFETLVALQGEPFGGAVTYAQWKVFQGCQRAGIRVLLEGQGADELLAGYPVFQSHQLTSLLSQRRPIAALRLIRDGNGSLREKAAVLRNALSKVRKGGVPNASRTAFPWIDERRLPDAHAADDLTGGSRRFLLRDALYRSLFRTKLPAFLRWGDRSAMSCSVENRVPFLTTTMAEFLFSLPDEYLLALDGTTKAVFREAMRGLVPDSILGRTDKIGFTTPYRRWIRSMRPKVADVLQDLHLIPFLDHDRIRRDCAGFLAGDDPPAVVVHHLWGLLSTLMWVRKFGVQFR